eukprot:CAMPEP_0195298306 /NCGR_PEP_ID=MMETSP0707-20130614/23211_1 /TAXON_ID=33640 /ORGANISM="Asterionellopsis glacialis, Strain CCMP134" /LENGTH=649 /DNA_ID=CAMNT_0040360371 /DNA_START=30 /DNA_END=1979 /DNA_ORIENTATION=+
MSSLRNLRTLGNAVIRVATANNNNNNGGGRILKSATTCSGRFASASNNRTVVRSLASAQPSSADDTNSNGEVGPQHEGKSTSKLLKEGDNHMEEEKRVRLSEVKIEDVLRAKHSLRWVEPVICQHSTIKEAIKTSIDGGLSGMMVIDQMDNKRVVGLVTSRDLLRILSGSFKESQLTDEQIMNQKVGDFMTPVSQVIYGKPEETIGMCRTIMAKLGIKCLPILSKKGRVEGLITAKDMNMYGMDAKDRGGKKSFLKDVSGRVGLSSNTSMAEPPPYLQAHLAMEQNPLFSNIAVSELPHPFKTHDGCGMNRRDYGPHDLATDPELSEDSHFVQNVKLPDEKGNKTREVMYFGVADGVGSWREYGVDPRDFSHKLMQECSNIIVEASDQGPNKIGEDKFRRMITPAEIIGQAYERVKADNIIGSSTACVALFDNTRHQLHFSNLGDSGIIVLRHIDSDIAGALKRDRTTPRERRTSDLRVAFVSQQQLVAFNHPFQLGWTGDESDVTGASFKSAADSCTTSIHIRRGDIIIMATDGLFDNVEVDDIASMALAWEQRHGFIRGGDILAREKRWAMGNSLSPISAEFTSELGDEICQKARENSLDNTKDSPFAILAKENDIMYSGGMPDDCTVIALHVVGRRADDILGQDHQ